MQLINKSIIEKVVSQAKDSQRKRMNYNFHKSYDANLQRMLNVLEPDTYIQPHKHEDPDKTEVFIILQGRILVMEFDDLGNITSHCLLSYTQGVFGAERGQRRLQTIQTGFNNEMWNYNC